MNPVIVIALFGWIPVTLGMFLLLRPRTAVLMSYLLGYLFLPLAKMSFPGMVDVDKSTIVSFSVFLGILACDAGRLSVLRIRWFDLPILAWCVSPLASSLTNGLGPYDGLSAMLANVTSYGAPYAVGRMYIRTTEDLKALATTLILGGLIYVPLCWYEIRLSPSLHNIVYGFHQHAFVQTRRFGGWRPMVFLQHGLALGLWMSATALIALWFWRMRCPTKVMRTPMIVVTLVLAATAFFCKSFGALGVMAIVASAMFASRWLRSAVPLVLLVLVTPTYLAGRVFFDYRAESVVSLIASIDEERAASLQGRIEADARLRDHALARPLFGWGGWNRFRTGIGPTLPDSLWAITLGQKGFFGLVSLFATLVLPGWLVLRRIRKRRVPIGRQPEAIALTGVLTMFALDCTVNAMICPLFLITAGALMAWMPASPTPSAGPRPQSAIGRRPTVGEAPFRGTPLPARRGSR